MLDSVRKRSKSNGHPSEHIEFKDLHQQRYTPRRNSAKDRVLKQSSTKKPSPDSIATDAAIKLHEIFSQAFSVSDAAKMNSLLHPTVRYYHTKSCTHVYNQEATMMFLVSSENTRMSRHIRNISPIEAISTEDDAQNNANTIRTTTTYSFGFASRYGAGFTETIEWEYENPQSLKAISIVRSPAYTTSTKPATKQPIAVKIASNPASFLISSAENILRSTKLKMLPTSPLMMVPQPKKDTTTNTPALLLSCRRISISNIKVLDDLSALAKVVNPVLFLCTASTGDVLWKSPVQKHRNLPEWSFTYDGIEIPGDVSVIELSIRDRRLLTCESLCATTVKVDDIIPPSLAAQIHCKAIEMKNNGSKSIRMDFTVERELDDYTRRRSSIEEKKVEVSEPSPETKPECRFARYMASALLLSFSFIIHLLTQTR